MNTKEHWGVLLVALIREFLADAPRATERLRDICRKCEVEHTWDRFIQRTRTGLRTDRRRRSLPSSELVDDIPARDGP